MFVPSGHISPASFAASIIAKFAELMVCATPKIVCVEGLPRRNSEPSSISSSLNENRKHECFSGIRKRATHIKDAECSLLATFLILATAGSGTSNQIFRASIDASRTPLEGSEVMYSYGASTCCYLVSDTS
jgi:hypothetical protein